MKRKIVVYILAVLTLLSLTVTLLASCSSVDRNYVGSTNGYPSAGKDFTADSSGDYEDGIGSLPSGGVDNPNAKIIKIADASINTENYEDFIEALYEKITAYKGYTDSDTLSGSAPSRRALPKRLP